MTPSSHADQPDLPRQAGESTPPEGPNPPRPGAAATPRPRRRWRPGLLLALVVGAAAAGTTWFLLPVPRPTVHTTLRVPQGSFFGEPVRDPESARRTQVALVRSRLVLNAALRDPEVAKLSVIAEQVEPVEWLEKEVQADFSVAPEVLRISMQGNNTDELEKVVKAVRDAYLKEVVEKETAARRERLEWLGKQRERFEARLREARETQREAERVAGGKDAALRARVLTFLQEDLRQTEQQLLKTKAHLRDAEVELKVLEAGEKDPASLEIPEADVEKALAEDKSVLESEKEVARLEKLLMATLGNLVLKEQDPELQRRRREVDRAQAQLNLHKRALRKPVIEKLRAQARTGISGKQAALRARITHLKRAKAMLEEEVEALRKSLAAKTERGIKLDELKEDLSQVEGWAKRLGDEEQKLDLELQDPTRAKVLEDPVVTRVNVASAQLARAGLSALAGVGGFILFGFAWVVLRFLVSVL
jgi:polysaccharide biosynthesis transport protein